MSKSKFEQLSINDSLAQKTVYPKFKNHFNKNEFPDDAIRNTLPSLAVPDQSLTIQEIIKRHARSLPIFGSEMQYEDGIDPLGGRDINSLDLEEVYQIATAARERYENAKAKFNADAKLEQEKRHREAIIKEHEELKAKSAGGVSQHVQNPNQGTKDE